MEHYPITVSHANEVHHFEVSEYPHDDGARCKYRVFEQGTFVVSFEPDKQNFLHICQNTAELDEVLLYQLAAQIEAQIPHPDDRHFNDQEEGQ